APMPLSPDLAKAVDSTVDRAATDLVAIARKIREHPELRFEEHKAAAWLSELVEGAGMKVERGVAGMPTAFLAPAGKTGGPPVRASRFWRSTMRCPKSDMRAGTT